MKSEADRSDGLFELAWALGALAVLIGTLPAAVWLFSVWKNPSRYRLRPIARFLIPGTSCLGMGLAIWCYGQAHFEALTQLHFARPRVKAHAALSPSFGVALVSFWLLGLGVALLATPLIARLKRPKPFVTMQDFWVRVGSFRKILGAFEDPKLLPLGIDLRTGEVVSLSQRRRSSHVIVLGATGTGKTILLVNSVLHAIRHNQPCIVIDPKGEDSTLELIRKIGRRLSPEFESRLKLFKLSNPDSSHSYNPLKHGNANQLKDRILEALNWSEQYYQALAGEYLSVLTAGFEKMALPLTLGTVAHVLSEKTEQARLLMRLKDALTDDDVQGRELYRRLSVLSERMKPADMLGLHAQLSILNSPAMGRILSGVGDPEREIDLRRVRKENQIAYFQLDTLGNPDTARRLGRIIIEDLKGLASHIYHTEADERARKFFPVFIDEFGSFASREFIEALKQMRGAKIAVHLFTQGFEDLDAVSPEFRRQATSNPMTKIALRLDDSETVNELASMAGTLECLEQSYQVEGVVLPSKTGMGNLRESRKMRVEHDVFKNLNTGQAVVMEKGPSRVSPIQVFHPDCLAALRKST